MTFAPTASTSPLQCRLPLPLHVMFLTLHLDILLSVSHECAYNPANDRVREYFHNFAAHSSLLLSLLGYGIGVAI
jgi:hypothetical protein